MVFLRRSFFLSTASFTDQTAVARMFLFLHIRIWLQTADRFFCRGRQPCSQSMPLLAFFFIDGLARSGILDTVEPRTGGVQFADDHCKVRVCDALSYHG